MIDKTESQIALYERFHSFQARPTQRRKKILVEEIEAFYKSMNAKSTCSILISPKARVDIVFNDSEVAASLFSLDPDTKEFLVRYGSRECREHWVCLQERFALSDKEMLLIEQAINLNI